MSNLINTTEATTTEATTKVTNGYVSQSTMSTDAINESMSGLNNAIKTTFDGFFRIVQYTAEKDEKSAAAREAAEAARKQQQYDHEERMEELKNANLDKQIKLEELKAKNRRADKI